MKIAEKLQKGLANPGEGARVVLAILRGRLVRVSCRLRGVRLEAGPNLLVFGRLHVRGPGRVILGANVRVERTVTPWTYHSDAVISIGSGSFLNGTAFGCAERIDIGPQAILSDASISDTDFHSLRADRHSPGAPVRVKPVVLEENVWVGARAGVLPGCRIGRNSVVGFGAVCRGTFPPDSIIVGNPATVVREIPTPDSGIAAPTSVPGTLAREPQRTG